MIPKNIFQTHKSYEFLAKNPQLYQAAFSWYKHKGFNYKFYTDKECDVFMQDNFPNLYSIYRLLSLPVMKADLWRYCVVYKYGGIYADVDTKLLQSPEIFIKNKDLVAAPENANRMCQWAFSAPAGSPILKSIIDHVVFQCRTNADRGKDFVLNLTGPGAFTNGIRRYMIESKQQLVRSQVYSPLGRSIPNNVYIFHYDDFHTNIVKHFFYGCKKNGWMEQRNSRIKQKKRDGFQLNVFS